MAEIICLSCFEKISDLENVFTCTKQHRFCSPCGKSLHLQCEVRSKFAFHISSQQNSIPCVFARRCENIRRLANKTYPKNFKGSDDCNQ